MSLGPLLKSKRMNVRRKSCQINVGLDSDVNEIIYEHISRQKNREIVIRQVTKSLLNRNCAETVYARICGHW